MFLQGYVTPAKHARQPGEVGFPDHLFPSFLIGPATTRYLLQSWHQILLPARTSRGKRRWCPQESGVALALPPGTSESSTLSSTEDGRFQPRWASRLMVSRVLQEPRPAKVDCSRLSSLNACSSSSI